MKRRTLSTVIVLFLLPQLAAAQKKSSVTVVYDKFQDVTCGRVDMGNLASSLERDLVLLDGYYCSPGKTIQPPTLITLRLISKTWGATHGPQIVFLLDGADRLTFATQLAYPSERILRDVGQITFKVTPGELEKITAAKLAEFRVFGYSYKLKQKELSKLNALAQAGLPTSQ
jgi:hypothetical protein